jgi:hypothetical protein
MAITNLLFTHGSTLLKISRVENLILSFPEAFFVAFLDKQKRKVNKEIKKGALQIQPSLDPKADWFVPHIDEAVTPSTA